MNIADYLSTIRIMKYYQNRQKTYERASSSFPSIFPAPFGRGEWGTLHPQCTSLYPTVPLLIRRGGEKGGGKRRRRLRRGGSREGEEEEEEEDENMKEYLYHHNHLIKCHLVVSVMWSSAEEITFKNVYEINNVVLKQWIK